jgi:hypothetical protein
VRLEFGLRQARGWVDITVEPNTNPEALGCSPRARDFPVCLATVTYPGKGYKAALGWVQLVRSTDGASAGEEFEMDPFEPLGQASHPFCFFGFVPTLFDAPSRPARREMDWTAESFLCFIADSPGGREARAILGFNWGFRIRQATVSLHSPTSLAAVEWNKHLALLHREHPAWDFAAGYRNE